MGFNLDLERLWALVVKPAEGAYGKVAKVVCLNQEVSRKNVSMAFLVGVAIGYGGGGGGGGGEQ